MKCIATLLPLALLGTVTTGANANALISPGVGSAPVVSCVAGATVTGWWLDTNDSRQVESTTQTFAGLLAAGGSAGRIGQRRSDLASWLSGWAGRFPLCRGFTKSM